MTLLFLGVTAPDELDERRCAGPESDASRGAGDRI
jgi:hypothetical protein